MNQDARPDPQFDALARWLSELPCCFGEIVIQRWEESGFELCHRDDRNRKDLSVGTVPGDAATIARYDDEGQYRPLKTAPNLRHGWQLKLRDLGQLRLALELFYPGRVAVLSAHEGGFLITTPLRQTLERQTGLYRVSARISDEQLNILVGRFCRSDGGCLRTILWSRDVGGITPSTLLPLEKFDPPYDQTGRGERAIPLLCQEGCNLLVAEARDVVKSTGQ